MQRIKPFTENATGRAGDVMLLLLFIEKFSEGQDFIVGSVDNWNKMMEAAGTVLDHLPNEDPHEALELIISDDDEIIVRMSQDAHNGITEFLEENGGPIDLDPV